MATIIERDTRSAGSSDGASAVSILLAVIAIAIVGALALYAFRYGAPANNPTTSPGGSINVDLNGGTPQPSNP